MGRALYTLLAAKLLPMQENADGSKLSKALAIATDKAQPNGYDLLYTMLKLLIGAFDDDVVEIKWPTFPDCERDINLFAAALDQTATMAKKRQQAIPHRSVALKFLNGVMVGTVGAHCLQAQLLKSDLCRYKAHEQLPRRFELSAMAYEIETAKPEEEDDPDVAPQKPSIYKTQMSTTGTSMDGKTAIDFDVDHEKQVKWAASIEPPTPTHLQGYKHEVWYLNKAMYRPSNDARGRRRPFRKPVPDPAKTIGKNPNAYDATIVCEACGLRGHPAARCYALAAAVFVDRYLKKETNSTTVQQALDFWMTRNAPMIRDNRTNEPLKANPLHIMHTYSARKEMSIEDMTDEIDWQYFDQDSTVEDVFGIVGGQNDGKAETDEST
jgi:hypothetical protein